MSKPSYLKLKNGNRLAYHKTEGSEPGIIFLGGFRSDMTGEKATALEAFCRQRGQAFVRFDYQGHGASDGNFIDCTIGSWKEDALAILKRLTKGPQILVGSSMGGWLAFLVAILKPQRIAGIIGIAAAPDFTERGMWDMFTPVQRKEIEDKGYIMITSSFGPPYPVTAHLIADGRDHLLLDGEIKVFCPVRLLHGMKDEVVPWELSMSINEKLASQDVKTILIEHGDHRLSMPKDIERLLRVTGKLLDGLEIPSS